MSYLFNEIITDHNLHEGKWKIEGETLFVCSCLGVVEETQEGRE